MQTITRILKTTGVVGAWAEERGDVADPPVLTLGTRVKLRIDLRTDELSQVDDFLIPLKQEDLICQSYYIALDVDFLQSTTPKLLNTSGLSIETDEAGHVFFVGEIPDGVADFRFLSEVRLDLIDIPIFRFLRSGGDGSAPPLRKRDTVTSPPTHAKYSGTSPERGPTAFPQD